MTKYSWSDVRQLEDSIASGRMSAEAIARVPGLATFSESARRDGALAEVLASATEGFSVTSFGAKGDGVTDDRVAIQAAITAAGPGGVVSLPGGRIYAVGTTLTYPEGLTIQSSGGTKAGTGTLKWIGAAGGTMLAPASLTQSNEGFQLRNVEIDGNSLLNIGVDLYHVSHALVRDCYIHHCNSGANACGIRLYRDRDAGYACYYNRIEGGRISLCTIGVFVTGTGAGSQNNCANANMLCGSLDFEQCATSVYFERGNDLALFGIKSENATAIHVRTAGSALHVIGCRIENNSGTPTLPGIQLDTTALGTIELANHWATFTNDPVQDSSTAKDIQRLSTFGTGVFGGVAGVLQAPRAWHSEVYSKPGSSLVDINGGAVGGTGKVRINRSTASADGIATAWYNGTGTAVQQLSTLGQFDDGYRQTIDGWYQENVAASQTDVALSRLATTTEVPTRWIALRSGSVTGLCVKLSTACTGGQLTLKVFKNGSQLGSLTAVIGNTETFKANSQNKDVATFIAGDELELRITTDGSWTPTTADIRAALEVET